MGGNVWEWTTESYSDTDSPYAIRGGNYSGGFAVYPAGVRIGLTLYRIQDIIDGDLDEIIDALHAEEIVEKLREMR